MGYVCFNCAEHLATIHMRPGLRLREIKDLLVIRDTGTCPCAPVEQLPQQRLTDVNRRRFIVSGPRNNRRYGNTNL